jgi:hypothetical protein
VRDSTAAKEKTPAAKKADAPEPPRRVASSMRRENRTLDSLPVFVASGSR